MTKKNENKIVEILAESLKKQDQQSELLTLLVKSDEKQSFILEQLVKSVNNLNDKIDTLNGKADQLRSDFNRMFDFLQTKQDKLEDRVKRSEGGFFKA